MKAPFVHGLDFGRTAISIIVTSLLPHESVYFHTAMLVLKQSIEDSQERIEMQCLHPVSASKSLNARARAFAVTDSQHSGQTGRDSEQAMNIDRAVHLFWKDPCWTFLHISVACLLQPAGCDSTLLAYCAAVMPLVFSDFL